LESAVLRDVLAMLALEPDLAVWRQNTGALPDPSGRLIRFGLCIGSSDIIGILAPTGRFLAIEVKRPGEKPTKLQTLFLAAIRRWGGFATVVHSAIDVHSAIERARRGECE
jgi:hypothetical protein